MDQEADRLAGIFGNLQNELTEAEQAAETEIEEYKRLSDWASLYKQCSFEEFRQLEIDGKSLPADPAQGIEKQA